MLMHTYPSMKTIIFIFICLLSFKAFSQNNIVIESKIRTENNKCENDTTEKIILIEMKVGENYKTVKKMKVKNCLNFYTFPKFTGKFRATVNAENFESNYLEFEIKATLKDTLILTEIVLKKIVAITFKEVTILGIKKKYIKIDADKTTVLVKTNEMLAEGSTYEAIIKLPVVL